MTDQNTSYYGTGRRKTAIARVWIKKGNGEIKVNGKISQDYFVRRTLEQIIRRPLVFVNQDKTFDVKASVCGGGVSGQAGALSLGISRALILSDPSLRKRLRDEGFLTRDPRTKERKKYGQKGARKRFQFSKR